MQNAPAMLAQKMMNRQAAYTPVGMVSQNMSGNKKGAAAGGAVVTAPGLTFDPTSATAGMTFSNNNVTATNSTGGAIASAKGSVTTAIGVSATYYWEFIVNSSGTARFGVGPASFVCNAVNQVGGTASGIAYQTTGSLFGNGSNLGGVSTTTTGDVLGFKLVLGATTSTLTVYKNNVADLSNYNSTSYVTGNGTAWVPIWSSGVTLVSASISNSIYEQAGTIPLGNPVIAASASVPAVADGKYDVYTFNASGTFTVASTGAVGALVIAGGGGSNTAESGAGGAGGYQEKGVVTTPQTYSITVGAGGASAIAQGLNNGSNSVFSTLTSIGGGSGELGGTGAGSAGGSGGGGTGTVGTPSPGGAGTSGQGFAGGTGNIISSYSGGGGGGAGGVGGSGNGAGIAGNGGVGATSSITGTAIQRAGGGGGRGFTTNGTATGGGGTNTTAATINTGGGGGGGYSAPNGGSGVVIIRVRARA